MTRDEIIEMARQAGWEMDDSCVLEPEVVWYICQGQLEAFAKLVAAKEREACAKVCEELVIEVVGNSALAVDQCARTIRARGEA